MRLRIVAVLAGMAIAGSAYAGESPSAFWHHQGAPISRGAPRVALANLADVASRFVGQRNFTGTRGPWCADAVSSWLRMTGRRPLSSRMAMSALSYGPRVSSPQRGDLAVMRSHVTIFESWSGPGSFIGLGGNQAHGHVARSRFPARMVVAFVRPL